MKLKDYRPVFFLPILLKIYERVVLKQITNFIEKKLIYHHYQSGYRKNHLTSTLLAKQQDDIKKAMKASEITLTVLMIKKKRFSYWIFSHLTDR